jgi:uncharacterized protein YciI
MAKKHFFLRLVPPRPSFPHDITEAERALMREHAAYFKQLFEAGRVLIYGPTLDAQNAFGMGVLEVEDEAEVRSIMDADPTVRAGLNRYELSPLLVAAARAL